MGASLIVSVFLAFSLSLSWFSGDKENGLLEDTIAETRAEQEAINQSYQLLTLKMRAKDAQEAKLKKKLDKEIKKQKTLKRRLSMEQRKLRMAVEAGTAVDIEGEREKIRKEVEERASQEIAKLEAQIATMAEEKQRLEENAGNGLIAKNGSSDGEGWVQAELARAKAREAVAQYKALKTELNELRAAQETARAMRRKSAEEEALAKAKAKRDALTARLKAAEKTLQSSNAEINNNIKENNDNAAEALVSEMEKASMLLRRKIEQRDRAIMELEHNAKIAIDKEKESLRSALEMKARKIAELEQELNVSKTREEALRASLQKSPKATEGVSAPVDSRRIDALRAKILNLQAKLQEVENKKQDFADQAKTEIESLRRKTRQLETKNTDMEKGLKASGPLKAKALNNRDEPLKIEALKEGAPLKAEAFDDGLPLKAEASQYGEPLKAKTFDKTQPLYKDEMPIQAETLKEGEPLKAEALDNSLPLKAEASQYGEPLKAGINPADEMSSGLMYKSPGLQTKLMDNDLADLQSLATTYVAQKMIDRNVELEAQLQDTRLRLAEAQSAYRDATAGFSGESKFTPGGEDTRAIITRYRKAATTITALNQRNVELEARASDTARALAEAEAARFIIEKLQARNLALEQKFIAMERAAAEKAAASAKPAPMIEVKDTRQIKALSGELTAKESVLPDEKVMDALNNSTTALAAPRASDIDIIDVKILDLPLEYSQSAAGNPVMLASIEQDKASQEMTDAPASAMIAANPVPLERDKELYKIIRVMEDMNYALQAAQDGSHASRPSLAEIHEEIRKLKKTILKKIDEGAISIEDIVRNAGEEGNFTFYMVQESDTAEDIAGKKELYGDPSLWPLIYKYNQSRLNQDDIIKSSRLLIIYHHLPENEKADAAKKAEKFGDWNKWSKENKRILIEDWIM